MPSAITPITRRLEHGWPATFAVRHRQADYIATEISNACLVFRGPSPLAPAWLTEITVMTERGPLALLVNVLSCDSESSDSHAIVAQPFALAGEVQVAWRQLVDRARQHAALGDP